MSLLRSCLSCSRSTRLLLRNGSLISQENAYKTIRARSLPQHTHFSTSTTHNEDEGVKATDNGAAKPVNSGPLLRRCLVTGGASGIGYEVTKQLLLNGASSVTITSRSSEKAKRAIDEIEADINSPQATLNYIECDFDKPVSPEQFLPIDPANSNSFNTLINCAGITQTQGLLSTSNETTSRILRTNLEAPIELSKQLLKTYFSHGKSLKRQSGNSNSLSQSQSYCIVNMSSLLAQRGGHGTSIYSASKAGLIAFTRTLTLEGAAIRDKYPELAPFRANVVVPGYIDTPMIKGFSEQYRRKLETEIPLRRYGTPKEVAEAVIFLLRCEYANNTVLNLDGGLSAT